MLCFFAKLTMHSRIYHKILSIHPFLWVCLILLLPILSKAQGGIEIIHADLFGFEQNGEKFQQLTNGVIVKQDNITLYCDSALSSCATNKS